MRTCLSVRGLSFIPLCFALAGASACNSSPTEPGAISDSAIVARSQSFETAAASAEASELTAKEAEQVDGDGPDSDQLAETEIDANSLPINTATAAPKGTVALSGVVRDRNRKRLSGVKVQIGGVSTTSDGSGRYKINTRPGSVSIKFSKTGYKTLVEREVVTRAMTLDVRLTAMPLTLSSLSLSDREVPVGTLVTATVKLTNTAPSGGVKVLLSSSSSAAEVPASVKVSGGKKSASFKVNAESAGSATITATYSKKSVKAALRVTGAPPPPPPPTPSGVVAEFTWTPTQCEVVEEAGGDPLLVKCRFDAGESAAPSGSTYRWTFPGSGNVFTRTTPILLNPPLKCGSVAEGAFGRTVTLVITTQSGDTSAPRSRTVTFTKDGLC